jgi:hypothetical protein
MSGAISPLPQYAFMAWCLVKKKSTGITVYLFMTFSADPKINLLINLLAMFIKN